MVCVKMSLDFSNIDVTLHASSNLEVLGIAVHGFSILIFTTPPSNSLTSTSLDFLSNFAKVILCVDFNAHHGMWGSEYTNCSGRSLVEALDVHDLVVPNTTTPTHFSLTGRNAWSLLDLVLVSSSCASLCTCTVTGEFLGSDHSILTNVNANTTLEDHGVPKWNLSKADWQKFSAACDQTLTSFSTSLSYAYCLFETSVREAAL